MSCVCQHITNISKTQRVIHFMSPTLYDSQVGVVTHATNSISQPYSTNSILQSGWRSHTCVHPHITNISKAPRVIHDMSRTLYYSRVGVVTRCSVQNTTLVSCLAACRPSCLVYVTHTHMHTHTHTHTHVRV